MRTMKKVAWLLSFVMIVSLIFENDSLTAFAEGEEKQNTTPTSTFTINITDSTGKSENKVEYRFSNDEWISAQSNTPTPIDINDKTSITVKVTKADGVNAVVDSGESNLAVNNNAIMGDGQTFDNLSQNTSYTLNVAFAQQEVIPQDGTDNDNTNNNTNVSHTVDFGTGSWTIDNVNVTANKTGSQSITESEEITLTGFDADTMMVQISCSDGFQTTLTVTGNKTSLSAKGAGSYPNSTLSFNVVAKNSEPPVDNDDGDTGTSTGVGDVKIAVSRADGTSKAYYRIGDTGEFIPINGSEITLTHENELKDTQDNTKIYFKAECDNTQILDTHNQNWYQKDSERVDFVLAQLTSGQSYITYNPTSSYNVQIAFDGGGGGDTPNVSFDCQCMGGNENERVSAIEVSRDSGTTWVLFSNGTLNSLSEYDKFKIRIKMNAGFKIDKISLQYESFDNPNRVDYFGESTNYTPIIQALTSDEGYEITFQPETDSKNADGISTLQAASTCLRLEYQTAKAFEQNVNINMFFQTQDKEKGYGIWERVDGGQDTFIDGAGASEIVFSFNDNNYGENGDPFELGYGKNNDSLISITYPSGYTGKAGQSVSVTPKEYDYFFAGGYTSGETENTIRIDNYDDLIDEVYIDVNGDSKFEESEKLIKTTGTDEQGRSYSYFETQLAAKATYNILIRKHLSTRVSLKWSYTDSGTDYYVNHGKIFIEQVKRGDTVLLQADKNNNSGDLELEKGVPKTSINQLNQDYKVSDSAGEAFLEVGDKVTIRLIPTYGYQIKEAKLNDGPSLTPNNEVSSFTFTVGGNLHLAGNFIKVEDTINTNAAAIISQGSISDGGNATDSGNLSLTVADHSGTYQNAGAALELAQQGVTTQTTPETIATLDMTLANMVSKGNGEYWTESITEFTEPITVNLSLNDTSYTAGDTYVVVREHGSGDNTELQKINATYSNGVLSVPTTKFSTYSIIKISAPPTKRPSGGNPGSNTGSTGGSSGTGGSSESNDTQSTTTTTTTTTTTANKNTNVATTTTTTNKATQPTKGVTTTTTKTPSKTEEKTDEKLVLPYQRAKEEPVSGTLQVSFGEGTVKVNVESQDEKGNMKGDGIIGVALGSFDNVLNAVLTEEEKNEVKAGNNVEVRLSMKKLTQEIPVAEQTAMEELVAEKSSQISGLTIGTYMDISMEKKLGNKAWKKLTNLNEEVEITIDIPKDLQMAGAQYWVVKNHNGEVSLLEDLDNKKDTVTIKSSEFSTYAIAYAVTETPEIEEDNQSQEAMEGSMSQAIEWEAQSTGNNWYWWILVIAAIVILAGVGGYFVYTKNTGNQNKE